MNNDNLEKSFSVVESSMEKFWDMWLLALGSFSWSQEQMESAIHQYLGQRKMERQEALKLSEELIKQSKKNQQQFQNLIKEAVASAVESVNFPTFNYIAELGKKVDDLSKKVKE